jgi:catechol 2,3-dioxygenase-like lactoylglutathione lyase family enzyme
MLSGGNVTLFVRDVATSVRFYVETLGMKLVEEGGPSWALIDAGEGLHIGLHALRAESSPGAPGPSAPSVGLTPKLPIREAIAILENRGVAFDIKEEGPRTLAFFRDPDDNALYLYATKS